MCMGALISSRQPLRCFPELVMANMFCFHRSFLLFVLVGSSSPLAISLSFTYNFTGSDGIKAAQSLNFEGDAFPTADGIQLTKNLRGLDVEGSLGRALSPDRLRLWDATSGNLTSFTTRFSFKISKYPNQMGGDGIAFFLAPVSYPILTGSNGGNLGLFNDSANQVVAAEFDTYSNPFDPPDDHIGIDVYSVKSIAFAILDNFTMSNSNNTPYATVTYDARAMNLTVLLSCCSEDHWINDRSWNVSRVMDLRKYLPEEVTFGFSATTGQTAESHTLLSWDFNSTELPTRSPAQPSPLSNPLEIANGKDSQTLLKLLLGVVVAVGIILSALGLAWFGLWQRQNKQRHVAAAAELSSMDNVFDQGRGPRRFGYQVLADATNNFAEAGKLGAGGFGSVYKGVLLAMNNLHVAIKKISRESMQGEKEYMSEVTLFSQLRHRNLVQLIGYCHEAEDFLLVYQYMPNRSLDKHLYNADRLLGWAERHKIAVGLASALLYLHEEWEQCVVHRDVKPSNVMLDLEFNAKLGDFGLARLVDHDCTAVTTVLAGTKGYIAPEYEKTGKARKESDVFSFGVVVLEIACGRKPINYAEDPDRINLVEWMWGLYEKGACLEAADRSLRNEFDERLMIRLMVVGLWCAHPDYRLRPSIRRAIGVLSFEAPLPDLPPHDMPRQEGNNAASSSSGGQSLNSISFSSYVSGR